MEEEKVIKEFLKLNPEVKEEDLVWRANGTLELRCKHDMMHTVYDPKRDRFIHGDCDGCCKGIKPYHKPEDYENEADRWAEEYGQFC